MLEPVRQLLGFARYAVARAPHEREDADALRELERQPLGLPKGLEVEWLGVAGYRLTYQGSSLVIDPYFSRASLGDVVRRRPILPDPTLVDRYLPASGEVVGVVAGHAHFDHAVDVPSVARRFGCPALGSQSLARLMRLHRLGKQAVEVEPYHEYELGPFGVTFVPSLHVKLLLGLAVPFDGEITCEHLEGLTGSAYRCGQAWGIHIAVAGATFYHNSSANLIDDAIRHRGVDYLLAGLPGRGYTPNFWSRLLGRVRPGMVVASHFDDFFRTLDDPIGFTTNVHLAGVPDEVRKVSRDLPVAALPRLSAVRG